jgi:hypothetical protein
LKEGHATMERKYGKIKKYETLLHCNKFVFEFVSPLCLLIPKVQGIFFTKTASKQPLFKARWILQTWGLF